MPVDAQLQPEIVQQALVPTETHPEAAASGGPRNRKCGLQVWVDANRKDIYTQKAWLCRVFTVEVNSYGLLGESASQYLLKHEAHKVYAKKHAAAKAASSGKQLDRCLGVELGTGDSEVLDKFESSCKRWVQGGCLRTQIAQDPNKPAKMDTASWLQSSTEKQGRNKWRWLTTPCADSSGII